MYSGCTLGISKVYSTFLGLLVVTNMDSIESAGATNGSSWCLRGCRRGVLARAARRLLEMPRLVCYFVYHVNV